MSPEDAAANSGARLALTYRLARQDADVPGRLPLLFRVDRELGISGGHGYLADCGGRGECHDLPGVLCLRHVEGPGRRQRLHLWHRPSTPDKASGYPVGTDNSGGCSGGSYGGGN
jgi:hypothetical protein